MANMNDVARHAGVSKSTVSKVLNNYPNLSKQTKSKVNEAIEALGYVPNQTASSLSKKNFKKIGIILKINDAKQTIDEINMQYLLGIDCGAVSSKVETSIIFSNTLDGKDTNEMINYIRSRSITSLIIIGLSKDDTTFLELIDRQVFPCVVTEVGLTNEKTSSVGIDNYAAQYEIAKNNIMKNEAKKVMYIEGKLDGYVSEYRKRAILDLEQELGIEIEYQKGEFSEQIAYQIAEDIDETYDLIICASDLMAIGVKRNLFRRNIHVDIIGFDGIELLSYVGEDIETVKQNFFELAKLSVVEALSIQAGQKAKNINIGYTIDCMENIHK